MNKGGGNGREGICLLLREAGRDKGVPKQFDFLRQGTTYTIKIEELVIMVFMIDMQDKGVSIQFFLRFYILSLR